MHSSGMRTAHSSSRSGGSTPGSTPRGQPPGSRHPPGADTLWTRHHREQAPPCGQTHPCKHITLPQTSLAGGKNNLGNHQLVQEANMTQPGHPVEQSKVVLSVKHLHDTHEDLFKIWISVRIPEKNTSTIFTVRK